MTDKCVEEFVVSKETIKASPLGTELSDDQCELLAEVTTACGIRDGAFLIEEGQQDDHNSGDRVEIEDDHRKYHEDHDANRFRNAIDRVTVHPFEDPACLLYRIDDHR